ncbi:hypothetical protein AeMF1_017925 [Aphanomyces euteiches]|nr:hypothetical protein AeMF1_017925 [Aphanomyces euteiches]KAH9183617.1 hypothetical protein AeNC1_014407 [Aphanomyces euteiches]
MMVRAQALARVVQEATDVVGTVKTGLETAMAKLEMSVRRSEELVQEVGAEKATDLDEFQAWVGASRALKGVIAKVVLDELEAYRKWRENDRLLVATLQAATSASKRGTDDPDARETKRLKGSGASDFTIAEEDAPEFFLGGSSGQSPDVIIVSSNEGSSVSSGSSDNESDEEDKESAATGPPTRGHIDEQGVQRLNHIRLPLTVKMAYILLEREEPWVQWLNHFRSFLPGLTDGQRQWNSRWYNFWKQFGEVVWQRYFFVGVGQYRMNPQTVHPTAQTSRKLLERAKSKMAKLIVALKDMEGLEVFEFLFSKCIRSGPN